MKNKQLLGSRTAKKGFQNEKDIVTKFNNWKTDNDAQVWLIGMGYSISEIEYVEAMVISGHKSDIQVQVTVKLKKAIDIENLQVKLVSNKRGFNQIDKRRVDKYAELWNIPKDVVLILKQYTGEISNNRSDTRDSRRLFADEFSKSSQNILLQWLEANKTMIASDTIRGRGKFSADWMLVARNTDMQTEWILQPINFVINFFGNGDVVITKRGSIHIGKITMQRKGGDAGRDSAKMLQFKINPAELFD